jgi:nitrate/TMAO reductase-like tetraheme cytochrome c subunit
MVMMNASWSPPSALNSPTVVQFPGDAHDTDFKLVSGVSSCMSASNSAGCAVCHSPSVMVMVNASWSPELFLNSPTVVQFPGDAHDTDFKLVSGVSSCMSSSNTAGCAVSHSPSVMVMVNASWSPELFLKYPTAVQFPGVAHDTDSKPALGVSSCMSASNSAGCAVCHSPSVMVMVNASWSPALFSKYPTAVQLPGAAHDTSEKFA